MAKKLSNFPDKFKASKGWFEKFIYRFNSKMGDVSLSYSEKEVLGIESLKSFVNSENRELEMSFRG
jgi:hypothetical protein